MQKVIVRMQKVIVHPDEPSKHVAYSPPKKGLKRLLKKIYVFFEIRAVFRTKQSGLT